MTDMNISSKPVKMPGLIKIIAKDVSPPPQWALLEHKLIKLMENSVSRMVDKYAENGGAFYFADDLDDLYELTYNWSLFYAMGADKQVFNLALQQWNATTRFFSDDIVSRKHSRFRPQIHNEYYNLATPAEWHHKGEGNMAFYHFGLADPSISENVRRSKRYAAMYMGDDAEAPNYDNKHKIFRCPLQTSQGPINNNNVTVERAVEMANTVLLGGAPRVGLKNTYYGARGTLFPILKDLEIDWFKTPQRRDQILNMFQDIVFTGDVPNSLGSTALMTNAYLYTGEDKYRRWVLDYTEAWINRMQRNNGIMPDNVGPNNQIGEKHEGQWWGGLFGWNSFLGHYIMFTSLTIAAECALLLTGDFAYLDLLRSQIKVLLENAITRSDGQLVLPTRYGLNGWEYEDLYGNATIYGKEGKLLPFRMHELAHLYHASMSSEDYNLITRIRETDKDRDWNHVPMVNEKNYGGDTELARFQYYDGKNPDWPEKILSAEYEKAEASFNSILNETRDPETLIADNVQPPNAVFTKGLTQVTMGSPQSIYTGGLLRATVRYFDSDHSRPGLPSDVVVLVDKLNAEGASIHVVNLNTSEMRNMIVQAGAFAEHEFVKLEYDGQTIPMKSKYFAIQLLPATSIQVNMVMRRFAYQPTYAFPWHNGKIPVPYQE
jgi:hypothetical protein